MRVLRSWQRAFDRYFRFDGKRERIPDVELLDSCGQRLSMRLLHKSAHPISVRHVQCLEISDKLTASLALKINTERSQ